MKRFLLGISLACLTVGAAGCCIWEGSGWTPCPWPGCGWEPEAGWNGGSNCGWGGWCGWGCNRPGGCGEWYWGDWCTGDPHCQTCDGCGNWVGPPSPGGNGLPPDVYGKAHPYGNQVARRGSSRPTRPQMEMQSEEFVDEQPQAQPEQMVRRPSPKQAPPMARRGSSRQYPTGRGAPQTARRGGNPGEYEGAVVHLGTTDRLVKAAELPSGRSSSSSASSSSVARRGEPTLADPQEEEAPVSQVRRTSRQSMR